MNLRAAAVVAAGVLSSATALAQSNLGYLRDAPSAKFNAQDFELLWAAVDEVSAGKTVGFAKSWENSATGSGGTIKLLGKFTSSDGRDCRRLRVDNHARSLKGSTTQIVCAHTDGTWLLDAGARPVQ